MKHLTPVRTRGTRFFLSVLTLLMSVIAISQDSLILNPVISGLNGPIQFVNAGDGSKRIFIVEKGGNIKLFDASYAAQGTFLTVAGVATDGEHGLLSVVFHPNYKNNGFLYTYYTIANGDLELARYHVSDDANRADPASKTLILTIPHPNYSNHNGGELHFGTDGFLYLSTGDGGGSGDQPNNAQNPARLLGKILRIDLDKPGESEYYSIPAGNPYNNEVYALGLRNPFRWSFDRLTGDIWIGDVGQDTWEEIDHIKNPTGGVNLGWRCYEGNAPFNNSQCTNNFQGAAYSYPTQDPAASVIGGVVYRGNKFAGLQGYYICADYFSGNFYKIDQSGTATIQTNLAKGISDFGENEDGEVFAVALADGKVSMVMDAQQAPLPVKLVSFTAVPHDRETTLLWRTASEQNTLSYEIELSSDGNSYTTVGAVPAKNDINGSDYQFTHQYIRTGTIYYRLKMIDVDGMYEYSNTVLVQYNGNGERDFIIPSIIQKGLPLTAYVNDGFSTLQIINSSGITVRRENLSGRTGKIEIQTSMLTTGIYFVELRSKDKIKTQKVLITN